MRNILAILERELKAYFVSPIAYVVLIIFSILSGLFFYNHLIFAMNYALRQGFQARMGGGQPVDVPAIVLRGFLSTVAVILLFLIPMITMGLFAEEKKRGTIELLLTSPVTDLEVVLGKFLAGLTFLAIMLAFSFLPVLSLFKYSTPDVGPFVCGYLGVLLYAAAALSLGLFVSTLTENQIIAAAIGFGLMLTLWLVDAFKPSAPSAYSDVIGYLSIIDHLEDFLKGVLASKHVIFYLSLMTFGLFLTYRSIESLRWRG